MTLPNMESSEMPQETESSEVQETVESAEVQEEAAQLEQATFEPEATVELESRHQDAEVVEAAFTEAMLGAETTNAEDAELIPENDNAPGEDVMIDTVPLPEKPSGRVAIIDSNDGPRRAVDNNLHTASDEVSATPITLPGQERVGGQGGRPGGGVEATPINLPNPQDEVSATPITLPGQAREIEQSRDSVSIIDTNDGPRVAVDDGPRVVDNVDTVGIIDTNDGPRAMDEMVDSGPGGRPGGGVEATPINLPNPQDEISATPITLPGQGKEASLDGKGDDRVAIGTWPTPDEEMEIAQKAAPSVLDARTGDERVKIDTVPLPEEPVMKSVSLDGSGADADMAAGLNDRTVGQVFDPDRVSEGGGRDDMWAADKGDAIGPMGGGDPRESLETPDHLGKDGILGDLPGVGKDKLADLNPMRGGGPGENIKPDDLGGPDSGIDQENELGSLADAAAPGGDPMVGGFVSWVKKTVGKIVNPAPEQTGNATAPRGTPNPEIGGESGNDPTMPVTVDPLDQALNYGASMMQPVDDEGQGREQPGMKMSAEELRDAQLNPYIQNTDDHVDVLPGSGNDMTDPKDFLIDNDLEPFAPGAGGGGTNPLAKPSTNDDAPPPPPPGGGIPGVSMDQMSDMVSSKPPDGGDGKPPDGADQVFKPSTNTDNPPPPPPGGGKPGVSMDQMSDMVSSKPPDGGDGKPPDGADLNLLNGLENALSSDTAPADLSSMMDEGTILNANENKDLKDLDETNTQNLAPTDGKL
jgi:hypothetical protein